MRFRRFVVSVALAIVSAGTMAAAQTLAVPHDSASTNGDAVPPGSGVLHLSATLGTDSMVARSGLEWRVFEDRPGSDGSGRMVAQSTASLPVFTLPDGTYIVHVTYGFVSQMKRVVVADKPTSERLAINAGALEVSGTLGDAAITADKLALSIYVPERGNSQAKLVVANAKPGQVLRLPEGMYHIVSTYLDTVGVGSLIPVSNTNSVVNADFRVQAGKIVRVTVRHHASTVTLKLVNQKGGEALANTSFTILTPGGDVIRELIGAFPSLVLAEGDYIAIARHAGKTYQSEFKVASAVDQDIEVPVQ